ncbi:HVO_0649 family zinc finger protein [Haloferax sp. YSMS24]|uniref:HVO_0649 family zinc finger protein n=1 Tax=unclassified Haloferax TaxID=2625095 RepID=UPI00398CDD0D
MSIRRTPRGTTALDRLRERYTDVERVCSECGFDDEDGEWSAKTTGSSVFYRHICPSCGNIETRTLSLK